MEKFDKRILKKEGEELQEYLAFKRKHYVVRAKKGKGSYNRKNFKKSVDTATEEQYNKEEDKERRF